MIVYKCYSCGTKLETDDSLSGKQEVCPSCQKVNRVPLSKGDHEEHLRREKERKCQEYAKKQEEQKQRQRELDAQMRATEEKKQQWAGEERVRREGIQRQQTKIENEKTEQSLRKATMADRLLWFSFKIAKTISAVVVGACLLVVIGCLVYMPMVQPDVALTPSPPTIPKVSSPQFSTLQAALKASVRTETSSYQNSPKRDFRVPVGPWYDDRLQLLVKNFSLKSDNIEMIKSCLKELTLVRQ